jgi:glycosyltransferase involved in cell wall biosynthesis
MDILIPVLHRPNKPTGVCRHAANLAQCLSEMDEIAKVNLIVGEWQAHYFEKTFKLSNPKINLLSVSIKNTSLSRNQWFLFGLPKLARRLQPNLIHLSFPFPFFRQFFDAPVVSTIHDLYPYVCPENFGYPQAWFNRWFLKQCINESDGLSCVSQSTFDDLRYFFPKLNSSNQTTVIYNYVNFSSSQSIKPTGISTGGNHDFLLCVAQHRKNKNLDILINAYAELRQQKILKPHTNLVIVGSPGPETKNILSQVQRLALQEQVLLLSSLQDEELRWLYENCEIFIIPSSTEGFCIPLVEALSLSSRVICSNIPVFQEVGSTRCQYFDLGEHSIYNLIGAITDVLSQPQIHQPSLDPRFSKSKVGQQLLSLYESVQ